MSSLESTLPSPRLLRSEEQPEVTFATRVARVALVQASRLQRPLAHESMLDTMEALALLEEALTIEIRPPTLRHDASEEAARDVSVSWHPEERLRGLSARELTGAGGKVLTIAQTPAASRQGRRRRPKT